MEKKALKYLIILLIIPIVVSIIIALASNSKGPSDEYNSLNTRGSEERYTYQEEIKKSNTFIYLSVFTLVIVGVGIWVYVRKKGDI